MQPLLSWMSLFNLDYFKIRWFCFSLHFVLNDVLIEGTFLFSN